MSAPTFRATLTALRERRGLSRARLAIQAGHDPSAIKKIESGYRTPSREMVLALAEVLELDGADTDRLLMQAGYCPRDLIGLFASTLNRLVLAPSPIVSGFASGANKNLAYLDDSLGRLDSDFNALAVEVADGQ